MRRRALYVLVIAIPVLLFANVFLAYRYHALEQEVADLEAQHRRLIEENKRIITGITVLERPDRVRDLATEELGLELITPDRIEWLVVPGAEDSP